MLTLAGAPDPKVYDSLLTGEVEPGDLQRLFLSDDAAEVVRQGRDGLVTVY